MNQYVTGAVIKELREKYHFTQAELAKKLNVSDKTISKWETAKGYPDISLLEPIAKTFGISITELISGNAVNNVNVSANVMRSKFYVCPVCGNSIHSMGEAVIQCHGIILTPCQAEQTDENHKIFIERVEDEYYVRVEHDMTKQHTQTTSLNRLLYWVIFISLVVVAFLLLVIKGCLLFEYAKIGG